MDLSKVEIKNSNTITQEERDAFMERFKKACKMKGMTVAYLQKELGKANAYFRNMGYITPVMARQLKQYIPDLNVEYMNTGKGEPFVTHEEKTDKKDTVPLLPVSAQGGSLNDFVMQVHDYDCEQIVSPIKKADFAISVAGDSMSPEYPNGCTVFVTRIYERDFIEWGKTYVLDTRNGTVIKNIYPCPNDDSKVVCRSVNPNYLDFEVETNDIIGWYLVRLQMCLK